MVKLGRREFIGAAVLGSAGAALPVHSEEERVLVAALAEGKATPPAAPEAGKQSALPQGKLGDLSVSRVILGGNLIGGWAHSRDLIYVSKLLKAYNTEERIFQTMALAEAHGVNTILVNPAYLAVVRRYNEQRQGHMQVISEIHLRPEGMPDAAIRDEVNRLCDQGADTIYVQGMCGDQVVRAGGMDLLKRTMERIKDAGFAAGIGSHTLEVTVACEQHQVGADYYMKTFHHANYWSASRPEDRVEWFEKGYHDNVWCTDAHKVREFMKTVKKPWLAFKVLGAGAIHPKQGFPFAFRNGADFIVVGMFDFQIAENVEIASKAIAGSRQRPRPWRA